MVNIFCFSRFKADRNRHELRKGNRRVKLERIPLELLFLLLEQHGNLLTREEIVQRIWGTELLLDTERSINTAVRKIRRALGDNPQKPKYLETIVGKGYRFVGALTQGEPGITEAVNEPPCPDSSRNDENEILLRRFTIERNGEAPVLTCEIVIGNIPLGRLPLVKLNLPRQVSVPLRPIDRLLLKVHGIELSLTAETLQALHAFSLSVLHSTITSSEHEVTSIDSNAAAENAQGILTAASRHDADWCPTSEQTAE